MMKHLFLFLIISFTWALHLYPQETISPDYIESGYYQLIYEADIASKEGNDNLAFEKLQEAERRCPLINQLMYQEMNLYSALLMKRREFEKALYYMEILATEYGTDNFRAYKTVNEDGGLLSDLVSVYPTFVDSIMPDLLNKSEAFYTPERNALIEELIAIKNRDQGIRNSSIDAERDASVSEEEINDFYKRMQEIDEENKQHILRIIEQHGFPNTKMYGNRFNPRLAGGMTVVFVHNFDDENLKALVLQYVRKGECPPDLYGFMVDREKLDRQEKYIYGIYDNASDDQIEDIERLNERRIAIGMPTREMERKRTELVNKTLNVKDAQLIQQIINNNTPAAN